MPTPPKQSYVWIRRIGKMWIVDLGLVYGCLGCSLGILMLLVLVFAAVLAVKHYWIVGGFFVGGWALFFALRWWQKFLLHRIKCPNCDYNPTRRKNDGKPLSTAKIYGRLREMEECPNCRYEGE